MQRFGHTLQHIDADLQHINADKQHESMIFLHAGSGRSVGQLPVETFLEVSKYKKNKKKKQETRMKK